MVHGQIVTTTPKAKALKPYIERIITKGIHAHTASSDAARVAALRFVRRKLGAGDPLAMDLLTNVVARVMEGRPGGYTRILKCGFRKGDAAPLAVFQLVTQDSPLERFLPDDYRHTLVPKEQYAALKEYCSRLTSPGRSVLDQWISFEFPDIAVKIQPLGNNDLQTRLILPGAQAWPVSQWPRWRGKRVPLELVIRFYLGAKEYQTATCTVVQKPPESSCVRLFPHGNDASSLSLAWFPDDEPMDKQEIVIQHRFHERPNKLTAAVFGPYRQLKAVRWEEHPEEFASMKTNTAHKK